MKGRGKNGPVVEFETRIGPKGELQVPPAALRRGDVRPGARVAVRLTSTRLLSALRERGVSENEIGKIAMVQMEPREQVVEFLLAEGRLAGRSRSGSRAKRRG